MITAAVDLSALLTITFSLSNTGLGAWCVVSDQIIFLNEMYNIE
jgi:hypothetical protein